jgi:hypothetical protein
VPQIATVGLVGGFWEDGTIGAPKEPAGFRLKSCKDDVILAQGKRSAALGCEPKMIVSLFFLSGLAPQRAKPERKKRDFGLGGHVPRAVASAALP